MKPRSHIKRRRRKKIVPISSVPSVAILLETATSWGRRLVTGVLNYAQQNGPWHIALQPRGPAEKLSLPAGWRGHGILGRIATPALAEKVIAAGVPVVNISSIELPGVNFPRVQTTLGAQTVMAFDFFRSRGFRHFAYVGDLRKPYILRLFQNFNAKVRELGNDAPFFLPDQGRQVLTAWLRELPKPVAVFCWGPDSGGQVIDACFTAGIPVPHRVAVLGVDYDDLLSEVSYPPQSGIRLATEQIGRTAASVLHQMMRGDTNIQSDYFVPPLGFIEKRSTDTFAIDDKALVGVMRFIQQHFRESIDVKDILRANPMARRTMERKFREAFGCSVIDQIRHARVNEAKILLASNDSIARIAEKCGFSTYNYMCRVFQDTIGMSPQNFRERFFSK